MSNELRGKAIHERRMTLGYSEVAFSQATGVDRGAIRRAEAGNAAARTYERLELWLDREESRTETIPSLDEGIMEFSLDVEGARAVVRGPASDPAKLRRELVELVREIRADSRPNGDKAAGS